MGLFGFLSFCFILNVRAGDFNAVQWGFEPTKTSLRSVSRFFFLVTSQCLNLTLENVKFRKVSNVFTLSPHVTLFTLSGHAALFTLGGHVALLFFPSISFWKDFTFSGKLTKSGGGGARL